MKHLSKYMLLFLMLLSSVFGNAQCDIKNDLAEALFADSDLITYFSKNPNATKAYELLYELNKGNSTQILELDFVANKLANQTPIQLKTIINTAGGYDSWKNLTNAGDDLLNASGKFIDDVLEADYAKYLTRKAKEVKTPKTRLNWKKARDYWLNDSPLARGNNFNKKAIRDKWYTYNEVTLKNGKRVDGYTLPRNGKPGEIVSRKATDLEDIQFSTFEKYLKEMKTKYSADEPINAPKYGDKLKGKVLEGKQILEIPASNQNFSRITEYTDLAKTKYGIEIRFRPE